MKKCPKCGAETFYVTAHVTQDWMVDGNEEYLGTIDDCVEVTHHPDDMDFLVLYKVRIRRQRKRV